MGPFWKRWLGLGRRAVPSGSPRRPPGGRDAVAPAGDPEGGGGGAEPEAVRLERSDTIDLHAFRPSDVPSVVREFLDAAAEEGFEQVRIIHGKGIGMQRAAVRAILERDDRVIAYGDAPDASGWGATVVRLARLRKP